MIDGIIKHVKENIIGRIADEGDSTRTLMEFVLLGGNGNHLEIGTLFGGSAICVALMKIQAGFTGNLYCIDPLDGYYMGTEYEKSVDPETQLPIDIKTLTENVERFGVSNRVIAWRKKSIPFPIPLDMRFSTAYIDGDHWGENPLIDIVNASMVTSKFIIVDNYDDKHPDVIKACKMADWLPNWKIVHINGITCVLGRK